MARPDKDFFSKPNKKQQKKSYKKNYIDEERKDQSRSIKSFKQRKRELDIDDEEWNNWEEEYRSE